MNVISRKDAFSEIIRYEANPLQGLKAEKRKEV